MCRSRTLPLGAGEPGQRQADPGIRDIDIPLLARHFYHHAGWAALIGTEFPGMGPVGVCGQIIPGTFRC